MARNANAEAPWRHPAFQRLWLGLSISYLGDQFTLIALLWFVLQLTGSGAAVGLVILCFDLPGVIAGAILGRLLDRYQPRLVMGLDNLARAVLIAAIPTLYALGSLQLWHIFVLALLAGALSPATAAGVRAFIPHLVDDAALNRANTLTATSLQFSYLAGPVAAGFAVAKLSGPWALFIDATSFLLMGLLMLTLPAIPRDSRVPQQAIANRWLGFGALFGLPSVPALTLLTLVFFFVLWPVGGGAADLQRPDAAHQRQRLRAAVDRFRRRSPRWCADADEAVAPLATEHCLTDDRGVVGSVAVPPVSHPTAPACDAVPRNGGGVMGALYADGNHAATATRPGPDAGQVFGARHSLVGAAFGGVLLQYLSAPLVILISGLACILAGLGGFVSPSLRQLQRESS